jgi:hypothetical protein
VGNTDDRQVEEVGDITPPEGDVERSISYFIPSTRLEGSSDDKLRKLEVLIVHLQDLRGRLVGDQSADKTRSRARRSYVDPRWRWFGAGVVMGAVPALLMWARVL